MAPKGNWPVTAIKIKGKVVAFDTACMRCHKDVRFAKVERLSGPNQAIVRPNAPHCTECWREIISHNRITSDKKETRA